MFGLYLLLLVIIIDNVRRVQFDENFIYLFLISSLGGLLFLNLQSKEVVPAMELSLLRGAFIDLFIVQKKADELFRFFRWLLERFKGFANPLNGSVFEGKRVGVLGVRKVGVNFVNRFVYTNVVLNFVF